jgi:ketosteroid isomerase-like protein
MSSAADTQPAEASCTPHTPGAFAADWIAAWNRRDLPALMEHYSHDIVVRACCIQHF